MFYDYDSDQLTGSILREELDSLPRRIRNKFVETVQVKQEETDWISFISPNNDRAIKILSQITNYFENKRDARARNRRLHMNSSGTYSKSDINDIYTIQKGLCYYTGVPIHNESKGFAIDHIKPVSNNGSSWPINLALTTPQANTEKSNMSKRKYFLLLENRHGKEWYLQQKKFCDEVDKLRHQIDKRRKAQIKHHIADMELELQSNFPSSEISYRLESNDTLVFTADSTVVTFPAGLLRKKKLFNSSEYIKRIIHAISTQS